MALLSSNSTRLLVESFQSSRPRILRPRQNIRYAQRKDSRLRRDVSTASSQFSEMEVDAPTSPRWSQTPRAMKAPVPMHRRSEGGQHDVNKDPRKLDDMYIAFLGEGGDKMLSDETKWLAVTHKSFDHGRRGFNDRLAFLGKRIVDLQASLGILNHASPSHLLRGNEDPYGRTPFSHPALDGVESLLSGTREWIVYHRQISKVASRYGIPEIMRWVPKNSHSLSASGADMVYAQAVFAIIGGLALEKGGAVANEVAKEKVLNVLGMNRPAGQPAGNIS